MHLATGRFMDLDELGWNLEREREFAARAKDSLVPAR
jgi:hypothetical protein